MKTLEVIFLDLGNVLLGVRYEHTLKQLSTQSSLSEDAIKELIYADGKMLEYELGWISSESYFKHLSSLLKFNGDWTELVQYWKEALYPLEDNLKFADELADRFRLCLISNTNEVHLNVFKEYELYKRFEACVCSHEIGYLKPREEIYKKALEVMNISAEKSLFVDDRSDNIEASNARGIPSYLLHPRASLRELIETKLK